VDSTHSSHTLFALRWLLVCALALVLGYGIFACSDLQGTECRSAEDCATDKLCKQGWCINKQTIETNETKTEQQTEPPTEPPQETIPEYQPRPDLQSQRNCPTLDARTLDAPQALRFTLPINTSAMFLNDEEYLYWYERESGQIYRLALFAKTGESPTLLQTNLTGIIRWTLDQQSLYVAIGQHKKVDDKQSDILKLSKSQPDATPITLTKNVPTPLRFAHQKEALYWVHGGDIDQEITGIPEGGIYRISKTDADQTPTLLLKDIRPAAIALDASHLYWVASHRNGELKRIAFDSNTPEVISKDLPFSDFVSIAGDYVYCTANSLWRVHKRLRTRQRRNKEVALHAHVMDDLFLYALGKNRGTLEQLPIACADPVVLSYDETLTNIQHLFVTSTHVLWLRDEKGSDDLLRLYAAKKRPPHLWYTSAANP
jgi:hypothetical protein